ncbi:MAG: universal stress protein [Caldisericaceae bacterium]|nr:universal stress protein [Caldisericaceae bacterium]
MFTKILYPTDFSESAKIALEYVKKLKEAGTREVILLHVFDERAIDLHWEIEAQLHPEESVGRAKHEVVKGMLEMGYGRLKELENEIAHLSFKTELIVKEGIPYQKIVETAADLNVSLIIMGSHGERGFVEKVLGTTTDRVIAHSTVPVLVVKPINNHDH